ncbi:MAG: HD-GYP domain-containing protein [Thermodesulfobacteriota bacterium]
MIKRISLEHLRPGMFVSSFDLSWFKHPFVSTRLGIIRDQKLIDELRRLGVSHVEVDTSLGVQAAAPDATTPAETPRPESPESFAFPPCPPQTDPLRTARFAKKLFDHATSVTRSLMQSVTSGGPAPAEEVRSLAGLLAESVGRNENVMHILLSLKTYDDYTYTHSLNLGALSVMLGTALELPRTELELLAMAGIVHDVGKCLLPKEIVNKPGPLTPDEFQQMKLHAALGHEHLQKQGAAFPERVLNVVRQHHERLDGAGYPDGISGGMIDRLSSIVSVADVYDALTSDRVYRSRVSQHAALRTLFGLRGCAFPEILVDLFVKKLGVYPAFSVVQLKNGFYAWVTRQTPGQPLFPEVMVFRDRERNPVTRRRVDTWRLCGELARKEFEILRPVEPEELEVPCAAGLA